MNRRAHLGALLRMWARTDEPHRAEAAALVARIGALDGIASLAHTHRIEGLAHRGMAALPGYDPTTADAKALAAAHDCAVAEHLRAIATLRRVGRALEPGSMPWLVLKGPVLAEHAYGDPAIRRAGDVDVLVPRSQFRQALELLEAAGGRHLHTNWREIHETAAGGIDIQLGAGPSVDLHWQLLVHAAQRAHFRIDVGELFERSVTTTLGRSLVIRALEPTDAAIHLALHACLSGAHRLGWLVDIDRQLRAQPPSWTALVERSRRWNVGLPVALALGRAARALDAPVPPDVTAGLLPNRACRAAFASVDRAFPVGGSPRDVTMPSRVARLAAPTVLEMTAQIARTGWRRVAPHASRGADRSAPTEPHHDDLAARWLQRIDRGVTP